MDYEVKTTYTLTLSEEEFEILYQCLEVGMTPADSSMSSEQFAADVKDLVNCLPKPQSRMK